MKEQKQYWWVSIGGGSCEPAVLSDGKFYTFGCPDAHDSNDVEMVELMDSPPDTPAEAAKKAAAWERKVARDAKRGIFHGYRRF